MDVRRGGRRGRPRDFGEGRRQGCAKGGQGFPFVGSASKSGTLDGPRCTPRRRLARNRNLEFAAPSKGFGDRGRRGRAGGGEGFLSVPSISESDDLEGLSRGAPLDGAGLPVEICNSRPLPGLSGAGDAQWAARALCRSRQLRSWTRFRRRGLAVPAASESSSPRRDPRVGLGPSFPFDGAGASSKTSRVRRRGSSAHRVVWNRGPRRARDRRVRRNCLLGENGEDSPARRRRWP